ncbi:MAG: HIT domain-containing protein [Chloroflexi bacterium]|nr:HIT domain-containing protein [Chloroflexota bacterium]
MERLWTPWRMAYVGGSGSRSECFLCEKAAEAKDQENLIVHRARLGFIVLNLYPYNSGHLLVAPYVHAGDLTALAPEVGHALFDLTQRAVAALQQEYQPEGFNVGMNLGRPAGAGLPDHLHIHVVPRWNGDTNFMPVVGQTKVLPETLDRTWERLRPHFP